jgi:iron complex outermembrane receptor protein
MNRLPSSLTLIALTVSAAFACAPSAHAQSAPAKDDQKSSDIGRINITGEGDRLGAGQIQPEETPKARSSVQRSSLEKLRPTANPYNALELLPGVNVWSFDNTGLFGGNISIRGFTDTQIGFTVDGVPVNDSGNYAVYPMEYTDTENLCSIFVTQGSTDVDAPHIGASGGNVGVVTCDPERNARFRATFSAGSNNLRRTFLRVDSGEIGGFSSFFSYSNTEADKWKGPGGAKREHLEAKLKFDTDSGHQFSMTALYNRMLNNNYYTPTRAEIAANGREVEFSRTFVGHLPAVAGTAQSEANQAPAFYKLSVNPFENYILTATANLKLTDSLRLTVSPYLWHGYGTGGTQQNRQSESAFLNPVTLLNTGRRDLNGDGDTLDTIIVARSSVTETDRPGISASLGGQFGAHTLTFAAWYERPEHKQTQPLTTVDSAGNADVWFRTNLITRSDGTFFQGRDWLTVSPAMQLSLQDSMSLLNDRLNITLGVRAPRVTRDFTAYANEGQASATVPAVSYNIKRTYDDILPAFGARLNIADATHLFANIAKNFRAPPNFAFSNTIPGTSTVTDSIKAETSWNSDIGLRYNGGMITASGSVFMVKFKDRQANAFDPVIARNVYTNAGDVDVKGAQLELGTAAVGGFSAYASLTYTDSSIKSDLRPGVTTTLPTSGKVFPLTPKWMAGLAGQYASGPFYVQLKGKHTGSQYTDLTNNDSVDSFTLFDLNAGYSLGKIGPLKASVVRLSIANLLDKQYLTPASGVQQNAIAYPGVSASTIRYLVGAPRTFSLSLQLDF